MWASRSYFLNLIFDYAQHPITEPKEIDSSDAGDEQESAKENSIGFIPPQKGTDQFGRRIKRT
jgi:hypothetical protein